MKRIVPTLLACALSAAIASDGFANGRPPASSSIHFRAGKPSDVALGLTWGLLISRDGGQSWEWMCEDAVGYGGAYDPDYEFLADGTILATTFEGLMAMRNGCTFDRTPLANAPDTPVQQKKFISVIASASDGTVFAADSGAGSEGRIHKSTDNAVTFATSTVVGKNGDWFSSLEVAPSDRSRLYVASYRLELGQPRQFFMYRSNDGGATYSSIPTAGFATTEQSNIEIAAISPTDPDIFLARVTQPPNVENGTDYYRTVDGGATYTKVLSIADRSVATVFRSDGTVYIGAVTTQSFKSTDGGVTFMPLAASKQTTCATLAPDGATWICAQNAEPDNMAIGKSTDFLTWTKVYQFADPLKPASCAAGTVQFDSCQVKLWCGIKTQFGITENTIDCSIDMTPDAGNVVKPPGKDPGCCDSSGSGASTALGVTWLGLIALKRRRRLTRVASGEQT